ncbi:MAG: hypothetical protein Q8936_24465 [Bacillota bacterium]|nr:hypothetical protein [Bacillota bacterium]
MVNCNECKNINLTEKDQIDKRIHHKCLKFNKRIFHRSQNPKIEHEYIYPYGKCDGKYFEKR